MQWPRRSVTVAALAAVSITLAAHAAAAIDLTAEERAKLHESITALKIASPPNEWTPEVGGSVPEDVKLLIIPTSLGIVKVIRFRYAVDDDTVVLADPLTREIVEVIGKDGASGGSGGKSE